MAVVPPVPEPMLPGSQHAGVVGLDAAAVAAAALGDVVVVVTPEAAAAAVAAVEQRPVEPVVGASAVVDVDSVAAGVGDELEGVREDRQVSFEPC